MVYGDDGDNNGGNNGGGSLILLCSLRGYIPSLLFLNSEENEMILFSFLSGGYLVTLILLSDTCPFLPLVSLFLFFQGSEHLLLFISSYIFFFLFLEHSSLEII